MTLENQKLTDVKHKRFSRRKAKEALDDIADQAVRNIAIRLAEIRQKGINYTVIDNVAIRYLPLVLTMPVS